MGLNSVLIVHRVLLPIEQLVLSVSMYNQAAMLTILEPTDPFFVNLEVIPQVLVHVHVYLVILELGTM